MNFISLEFEIILYT